MIVRVLASVVNNRAHWPALDRILSLVADGQHLLDVTSAGNVVASDWLLSGGYVGNVNREIIEKQTVALFGYRAFGACHTRVVTVDETSSPTTFTPQQAFDILRRPVYVIVENSNADRAFIQRMAAIYGANELSRAIVNEFIEFVHSGGGGEMVRLAREHLPTLGPRRTFIFADSDSLFPGHVSRQVQRLTECCLSDEIPGFLLSKREIENYLPVEALQASDSRQVAAFLELSADQQSHLDMKGGVVNQGVVHIHADQVALFAGVANRVLSELNGFGRDVGRYFGEHHPSFGREQMAFVCRTLPNEIRQLLESIEALV